MIRLYLGSEANFPMETNEVSQNARGGTEIMLAGLAERIDPELLSNFQIIPSRVRDLSPDKIRILWLHDLPEDPESEKALSNGGWKRFHRLVFVSNWQMQRYIEKYNIEWDRCAVMHNAIVPIPEHGKPKGPTRLIYISTPHRGLDVLSTVFNKLCENDPGVELEVFSSFALYGWPDSDKSFEPLFERLRANPKVTYHGARPNDEVREALMRSHVFAYPSTWIETSCICLMEAMSAGLVCVHPNLGALFETAGNMTMMYQWVHDKNKHAATFYSALSSSIEIAREDSEAVRNKLASQRSYANLFYDWKGRAAHWDAYLRGLIHLPREIEEPSVPMFEYRIA